MKKICITLHTNRQVLSKIITLDYIDNKLPWNTTLGNISLTQLACKIISGSNICQPLLHWFLS